MYISPHFVNIEINQTTLRVANKVNKVYSIVCVYVCAGYAEQIVRNITVTFVNLTM